MKVFFVYFICLCCVSGSLLSQESDAEKSSNGRQVVKDLSEEKNWLPNPITFTKEEVEKSVELLQVYFLNNQDVKTSKFRGDFLFRDAIYRQDKTLQTQTFGVAGLAAFATKRSNPKVREFLVNTLSELMNHNQKIEQVSLLMPFSEVNQTSTVVPAMVINSLAPFIAEQRTYMTEESRISFEKLLKSYMITLDSLKISDGGWGEYLNRKGIGSKERDGFIDGACFLAYVRAVQLLKFTEFKPELEAKIPELIKYYLFVERQQNIDSASLANFTMLGMMGLAEYAQTEEKDAQLAGDATLAMAWWLIHTYKVESKSRSNGAYIPALCSAWKIAKIRKLPEVEKRLQQVVENLLMTMMTKQLGHDFSVNHLSFADEPYMTITPEKVNGGVINILGKRAGVSLIQNYWCALGGLLYLEMQE